MTQISRPRKIGVDGGALVKDYPTGVEKATAEILQALFKVDTDNQYFIYTTAPLPVYFKNLSNVTERVVPYRRFWTQTALPLAMEQDDLDIFWSPSNVLPPKLPPKSLATIHDVAFVVHPEIYSWWSRILQRTTVLRAKSSATKIIAITESTKADIERYFNVSESMIEVVPIARPRGHQAETKSIPKWENYILAVGRVEHKKNSLNIVKSFSALLTKYPDLHLVFAGPAGYGFKTIKKYVENSNIQNHIHFLGFVSNEELGGLYHHAKLLLFPSLYEGFGMTILEGFVASIPVVTSNLGAMKEVAGNAAMLVDPHNIDDMMMGVDKLLSDEAMRQKYIEAGRIRLQDFSWEKSANQIKNIINNL